MFQRAVEMFHEYGCCRIRNAPQRRHCLGGTSRKKTARHPDDALTLDLSSECRFAAAQYDERCLPVQRVDIAQSYEPVLRLSLWIEP